MGPRDGRRLAVLMGTAAAVVMTVSGGALAQDASPAPAGLLGATTVAAGSTLLMMS